MKNMVFTVSDGGRVETIYSDQAAALLRTAGVVTRETYRASDVEPDRAGRWTVWIRRWARTWQLGPFRLTLSRGHELTERYDTRDAALAAEVAYLIGRL